MKKQGTPVDASSLIYLAKASGLAAANACVGPLLVPPAVWREVVQAGEARGDPETHRVANAESSGWVSRVVLDGRQRRAAQALMTEFKLGAGESEVLALGHDRQLVIIDEFRGTRIAQLLGIVVASTLMIPLLCADRRVLDAAQSLKLLHDIARYAGAGASEIDRVGQRIKECFQ